METKEKLNKKPSNKENDLETKRKFNKKNKNVSESGVGGG